MFNIISYGDYLELVERKIKKTGNEVNGTYEILGTQLNLGLVETKNIEEIFNISPEFTREFTDALFKFQNKTIGPYQMDKYLFLVPAVMDAITMLEKDCFETRRAVIQFPPEHCFQSIQFIIRENTINTICYMRSCNAIKNLPHDIWICSLLSDMFKSQANEVYGINLYPYHKITMVIGSLHVFKEDL